MGAGKKLKEALQLCKDYHYVFGLSKLQYNEFCEELHLSLKQGKHYIDKLRRIGVIESVEYGYLIFVDDFYKQRKREEGGGFMAADEVEPSIETFI